VGRSKATAFKLLRAVALKLRPFLFSIFAFKGPEVNIVLIGYRCTGKTEVGKILAESLGFHFMDTDRLIEMSSGIPVHLLVAQRGWPRFRELERQIVHQLSELDNQVIATGGGVVMDSENIRDLKKKGWLIWLKAPADVLRKRLKASAENGQIRPPLTDAAAEDEISALLAVREPLYAQAGDMVIDTSTCSIEETAAKVLENLPLTIWRKDA
jgi:shikimate kinase